MKRVGSGASTATFKNRHGQAEITFYDKVMKIEERGRYASIPEHWGDKSVLRVEARFKKPKRVFGRPVTLGMLCDEAFWVEVAYQFEKLALSVGLREGPWALAVPQSVPEMRQVYAASYIHESGGLDTALARINHAYSRGELQKHQASRQRKDVRHLSQTYAPGDQTLAKELTELIHEAAGSARLVPEP